jgi:hypothetical protein
MRNFHEWKNQEVRMKLEDNAWSTNEKLIFIARCQKKLHLVTLL